MAGSTRTIRVKIDGDADGFAKAARSAERSVKDIDRSISGLGKKGSSSEKGGRNAAERFAAGFKKSGAKALANVAENLTGVFGRVFGTATSSSPAIGGAIVTALLAGAAIAGPAAGAVAASGLVFGFGAGIAGLGLVFAAKSEQVKGAWSKTLDSMGSQMSKLSKPFEKTLFAMAEVADRTFQSFAPKLDRAFSKLAPAVTRFGDQFGRALEGLAPALEPLSDAFREVLDTMGPASQSLIKSMSRGLTDLADSVKRNPSGLADMTRGLGTVFTSVTGLLAKLNDINGKFRELTGGTSAVDVLFRAVAATVDTTTAAFTALAAPINGSLSLLRKLGIVGEDTAGGVKATWTEIDKSNGKLGQNAAKTGAAVVAGEQQAATAKKQKDAAAALVQQFEEQIDALFRLQNQTLGVRGAQVTYEAALDDATASLKTNGRTLDVNTEKGRANRSALDTIATSAKAQTEAMIRAGASNTATAATAERSRAAFVKQAIQMGMSKKAAQALGVQLIAIPNVTRIAKLIADKKDLDTKLAAARSALADPNLTRERRAKLNAEISSLLAQKKRAQDAINSLTGKTVTLTTNVYRNMIETTKHVDVGVRAPGRASGGIVQPRKEYLVGERGPEKITIGNTGGRVTSTERLGEGASGAPMMAEIHIEIGGEVTRVVRTEIRADKRDTRRAAKARTAR